MTSLGFSSAIPLFSLCLKSFRSLEIPHQINILRHPFLLPYTSAQSHRPNLEEDLELWGQTTVDP